MDDRPSLFVSTVNVEQRSFNKTPVTTFDDPTVFKVTDAMIMEAQRALNFIFPDDYKSFLRIFNGEKPNPNILLIPDVNEKVIVESFFGIGRKYFDLEKHNVELRHSLDMQKQFLAIACDVTNNSLIMEIEASRNPSIYYWDSARQFDSSTDAENAYLIADSFTDLLTKFKATL